MGHEDKIQNDSFCFVENMGLELEAKGDMVEEQLMCRPGKKLKLMLLVRSMLNLLVSFPGPEAGGIIEWWLALCFVGYL